MTTFPKFWHMTSFWPPKWPYFDHFWQKWPILTKFTPLMTFLTRFMSINLTEIIFRNFWEKIIWPISPNFDTWRHFGTQNMPKWPDFEHFHQKWPILTKLAPLITYLTKFLSINLTEIIFRNIYGKNYLTIFPKLSPYDVIFAPKISQYWPFSPKMAYFDQIYAINDIFHKISVHKIDWNHF